MIKASCIIMGPGGIGKSPLGKLFNVDHTWDPYRMRIKGPRSTDKTKYVSPTVYLQFQLTLQMLGDNAIVVGDLNEAPLIDDIPGSYILSSMERRWFDENRVKVLWYPRSNILFYPVRTEQFQMLVLDGDGIVQAELYAPVLGQLLQNSELIAKFGKLSVLILNPINMKLDNRLVVEIQEKTKTYCEWRSGESESESVDKRVKTIPTELLIWNSLADLSCVHDCVYWKWPEGRYIQPHLSSSTLNLKDGDLTNFEKENPKPPFSINSLLKHQKELLKQIRKYLVDNNYVTEDVLKNCEEIDNIAELIVQIPDSLKYLVATDS